MTTHRRVKIAMLIFRVRSALLEWNHRTRSGLIKWFTWRALDAATAGYNRLRWH